MLACILEIGKPKFILDDVYGSQERLRGMHIDNRNVRPKIRQQLQAQRDCGALEFLGHGKYRVLLVPETM